MSTDTNSADASTELPAPEDDVETIDPPDLTSSVTYIGQWWQYRKYRKELKKKVGEGYIAWYLIDDGVPGQPKWIKPEDKGGGVPEYEHDGETYLFPRNCRLPNKQYGTWAVYHSKGDPEPIDLRDPREPVISAAALYRFAKMKVNVDEPASGMFGFDMEYEQMVTYGVMGTIVLIVLYAVLGGVF